MKQRMNQAGFGYFLAVALAIFCATSVRAETLVQGMMKLDPVGIDALLREDYAIAYPRLMREAQKGKEWAMYLVGNMLSDGNGVPQNYAEASKWYLRAAGKGNAEAMERLGKSYDDGLGVPKNGLESIKWYKNAATKGNSNAMLVLSYKYADGAGVPQDYSIAAKWLKECSEKGLSGCMVRYGYFLEIGQGIEKDLVAAYAWFNVAASKGDLIKGTAEKFRARVAQELSPEQLSKAQALSLQFSTTNARWKSLQGGG